MARQISSSQPSPAQLAAWRLLWRLLLSVPPTPTADELAKPASEPGEPPEAA